MADPAVCGFLTGLLCTHGGRMQLRELLGLIELPEAQLLEVLREAGPDRFVLLDEGSEAGPTVLATTRVRVCRRVMCSGPCEALHLCKLNLLDRCRRERNYCKYSHEIHSEKNIKILKRHDLSVLTKEELAVLLPQSDPFFLPDICKYYKGEGRQDSCSKKTECMKLHICEHFLEGRCGYVHCNRSHNLMDTKVLELLKEEGLTVSVVKNIQDICNQKHTRSNKRIPRRRGPSEQKNGGGRSQSRNRYFFGRQEMSPPPSASFGSAYLLEPDKTDPAPLPYSESRVNESGATKNNVTLSQDCSQPVSATPKTARTQEVSQVGTKLSFPVTGHIGNHRGSQDGIQHAASLSPPASADKGATPAISSHTSRRVNVFFGSEAESSSSDPVTTSKSGLGPSQKYTDVGDDFASQKAYFSPAPKETLDIRGKGNNAVVFSKYKPTTNLKKEESSFKSTDKQSMLVNPPMTKTATLISKLETPTANNTVADDSCSVKSRTLCNKQLQPVESVACKVDAMTLGSERIIRNEREEPFYVPQSIQASPMSNTATAQVRPKASSAVMQATSVSTPALDHKTATSFLRKQVAHQPVLSGSQVASTFTSGSSKTLGTLTTNKSRAVSPSKSTNAEDFKARVSNTPSGIEKNGSNKICLDYLSGDCKLQSHCKSVHFHLPYRWQVCISDYWKDFKEMEEIEKAYCDPSISRSHNIDFQKMLLGCYPVRRLSTLSAVQNHDHVLATKWLWYWKNELDQWIEYGKEGSTEFTSVELEFFFLLCPEEFVEFSEGRHKYTLNFKEMIQTNIVSLTKREVRRRPKFVSSVTVYWTQKKEIQHQEQNKNVSFNFPSHWDELNQLQTASKIPSSSAECERNCSLLENTHMKSRSKQARGKIEKLVSMWENLHFTEVHKEENHKISGEAETTDSDSSEI